MKTPKKNMVFDEDCSKKYDKYWVKLSAMKEALHLLTQVVLSELPRDAHILCIGAGTGEEIFGLGRHHPHWRFTAVDTSRHMLEICQRKAREQGIASRCTFHADHLSSLSTSDKFDAATCFLVSHFLTDRDERQALFTEIGSRLVPNGRLVTADFSGDTTSPGFNSLLSLWLRMMRYAGLPEDEIEGMRSSIFSLDGDVSILPPKDIETMINAGGFGKSTLFFQSILVHAWCSTLAA